MAVFEDLEARDVGVLQEHGECVGVGVLGQAVGEIGFRAPWVVVDGHVLLLFAEHILHVVFIEAQAEGDRAHEPEPQEPDFAAVGADDLPGKKSVASCMLSASGARAVKSRGFDFKVKQTDHACL